MPALPQMNPGPTQWKPTPFSSHSVCPFIGQANGIFQRGKFTSFEGNHVPVGQSTWLESVFPLFRAGQLVITSVEFQVPSPGVNLLPFRSCQPWSNWEISKELGQGRGRDSDSLGWVFSPELSWAARTGGAHGNCCETDLRRSSSSAKCSRAEDTACR